MNAETLIDPSATSGMPAPFWFVEFFKVLGFTLHAVPMNLWYAGLLVAMLLWIGRNEHGRRFSTRLMRQMPVIVALGVNFGVVPLLFTQVAYYKVFYPATILMAWFWLLIVVLLIPAYYGVYFYASGLRGEAGLTPARKAAGWTSAVFFIAIGFLFANGLSLMAHVERWPELWQAHRMGGAALGTALNIGDPSLWPRWLLMFGLALTTTAAWVFFDAAFFARAESEDYRRWAARFAPGLYTFGMIFFAAAGSWYVFGTWPAELRQTMTAGGLLVLTMATGMAPGLPFLLLWMRRNGLPTRAAAALIALAQFGVLGINAISRHLVQKVSLEGFLDVSAQPLAVQWGPMAVFLTTFLLGLGVIAWMLAQLGKTPEGPLEL
ncbi:MAG TPA: hypothetical protein VMY42_27565 [Thermoguttaceae bacterium]|nr:hypothetical protein [Thermoguttaceae bacterium]